MLLRLWLLFCVVPLAELALLIWLAQRTSLWFTVGLVVVTGLIGAALARQQGWRTWRRIAVETAEGRIPADALFDAAMILSAGLLLITPGVMTDIVGFGLLIPPCRRVIKRWLAVRLRGHVTMHTSFRFTPPDDEPPEHVPPHDRGEVIDVQFKETARGRSSE